MCSGSSQEVWCNSDSLTSATAQELVENDYPQNTKHFSSSFGKLFSEPWGSTLWQPVHKQVAKKIVKDSLDVGALIDEKRGIYGHPLTASIFDDEVISISDAILKTESPSPKKRKQVSQAVAVAVATRYLEKFLRSIQSATHGLSDHNKNSLAASLLLNYKSICEYINSSEGTGNGNQQACYLPTSTEHNLRVARREQAIG